MCCWLLFKYILLPTAILRKQRKNNMIELIWFERIFQLEAHFQLFKTENVELFAQLKSAEQGICVCKFDLMNLGQILEKFWLLLKFLRFFWENFKVLVTVTKHAIDDISSQYVAIVWFSFLFYQVWPITSKLYNIIQCHKLLMIDIIVVRFLSFFSLSIPV